MTRQAGCPPNVFGPDLQFLVSGDKVQKKKSFNGRQVCMVFLSKIGRILSPLFQIFQKFSASCISVGWIPFRKWREKTFILKIQFFYLDDHKDIANVIMNHRNQKSSTKRSTEGTNRTQINVGGAVKMPN